MQPHDTSPLAIRIYKRHATRSLLILQPHTERRLGYVTKQIPRLRVRLHRGIRIRERHWEPEGVMILHMMINILAHTIGTVITEYTRVRSRRVLLPRPPRRQRRALVAEPLAPERPRRVDPAPLARGPV